MQLSGDIRVAIVEDDSGTREGLAILIDGTPGYGCVATYGSLEEAFAASEIRFRTYCY
jgi:hypothetical protein